VSSSSPAFFFLLPGLAPFAVGWLDSRVGNDDTGVAAWDGVVPAEAGVEASCDAQSAQVPQCSAVQCSAVQAAAAAAAATATAVSLLCRQRTRRKLEELRLKMRSVSLTWALRRVAVPAPPVVVVVAAPLM
jgi:hypothetical protein